jgi:hypothetical protein
MAGGCSCWQLASGKRQVATDKKTATAAFLVVWFLVFDAIADAPMPCRLLLLVVSHLIFAICCLLFYGIYHGGSWSFEAALGNKNTPPSRLLPDVMHKRGANETG